LKAPSREVKKQMATAFPWPVTDDELLLNDALDTVVARSLPASQPDRERLVMAAANLIVDAYNQGVREQVVLVRYTLDALRKVKNGRQPHG
jgi:hypothetical protein